MGARSNCLTIRVSLGFCCFIRNWAHGS